MGYYTQYAIKVDNQELDIDEIQKEIEEISGYENSFDNDSTEIFSDGSIKWYESTEDMKKVSTKYPNTLFTVKGKGEESGDIWSEYHKNGKVHKAKTQIIIEPFDEEKLK